MKEFAEKCFGRFELLVRWILVAGPTGIILGIFGGLFGKSITIVTAFRNTHPWMLYLLPAAGLLIVAIYKLDPYKTGTNRVLEGVQSDTYVPLRMAPLIVVSTILTHAFGGSAGREGAALQLGGSIGGTLGKWMKFDEYDHKLMIICGMSAGFSALFGTPLTATIFAMEVISVGIMQYAALVPCAMASLIAHQVALMVGAGSERFDIINIPALNLKTAALTVLLGFLCAGVSILFCTVLHRAEHWYKEIIPNEWVRIVAGALLVIVMAKLLNTTDYLGTGMNVVERALNGETEAAAFLLKIVFTAVTLGCGFRGGESVPTLFVGATFGCLFGQLTGLSPSMAAACGMAAVFCGVTNCPLTALVISFELFGFAAPPLFLLALAVSYMLSGYYGLYHSQKILYSKTKLQFINTHTKE